MNDWADKFIEEIYRPLLSGVFLFQGLLVGEVFLKDLEKCKKLKIKRDYINWKAWIYEE